MEFFPLPAMRSEGAKLKLFEGTVLCWRCCHPAARDTVSGRWLEGRAELRIRGFGPCLRPQCLFGSNHTYGQAGETWATRGGVGAV